VHTLGSAEYRDWPTAPEMLRAVTRSGARAVRRAGTLGRLEVGCDADIALLDLDTLPFTPLNDLRRQLVFCEDGTSVRQVIVAGELVFDEGRVRTVDERALRAEARELAAAHAAALAGVARDADRLAPHYREMYLRAARRDVGFSRWLQ